MSYFKNTHDSKNQTSSKWKRMFLCISNYLLKPHKQRETEIKFLSLFYNKIAVIFFLNYKLSKRVYVRPNNKIFSIKLFYEIIIYVDDLIAIGH